MKSHINEEENIKANGHLQMKLYDINKQIIAQQTKYSIEQLDEARATISEYIKNHNNNFYMLLCRDINYYTLFQIISELKEPDAATEILECADFIGDIKSVSKEDSAIEIWVHPREEEQEPIAMYLFPYDGGVIKCIV